MNETSNLEEKRVRVLVENYDINNFKPKPFHHVISIISVDKVKEIIKRMPSETEKFNKKIRVITDDYIFSKSGNLIVIQYNRLGNFFWRWRDLFFSPVQYKFSIDGLEDEALFQRRTDFPLYLRILAFIVLTILTSFIPFFNIMILINNFGIFLTLNLSYKIILSILITISIVVIIKIVWEGIKTSFKKVRLIEIDKYIPYLNYVKTIDFDYPIIMIGQIFYTLIFQLYSFTIPPYANYFAPYNYFLSGDILGAILASMASFSGVSFVFTSIGSLIFLYKNHLSKNLLLDFLGNKIGANDGLDENIDQIMKLMKKSENLYFIQMYNLIKRKKIWEVGLLAAMASIISAFLSLLPII